MISLISREVVQLLTQDGDVVVEAMRAADVEMDLSAIMHEYLNSEDRVNEATRATLEGRGYDDSKFHQVKREMAEVHGFRLGSSLAGTWRKSSRQTLSCAERFSR